MEYKERTFGNYKNVDKSMYDRRKEDMWMGYWINWSTNGPIPLLLDEDNDDSINRMWILKCITQTSGNILYQCYLVSSSIQHIRIDAHQQQQ